MILYIIRHGDPSYENDSLTEKGIKQAEALVPRLAQKGFTQIFSSPNGRAKLTAKPLCDELNIECQIEPWMSEDLAWQDLSHETESYKREWAIYKQNTVLLTDPAIYSGEPWHKAVFLKGTNAETGYQRIKKHSDEFTERLGYRREGDIYRIIRPNDDYIAAFNHHGFGLTWLSYLLAIPPYIMWSRFNITTTGVTVLTFDNNKDGYTAPLCQCLSDTSHLYKEGINNVYNI